MGIEFKLTDRELPASPPFMLFLAPWLERRPVVDEVWADQRSEQLTPEDPQLIARASAAAARVMGDARGREQVARAYQLFAALLTGAPAPLQSLQQRFRFITINGIARTGGSYLTAELCRALGMSPVQVPHMLAHDSFPEAGPLQLQPGFNSWVFSLKTLAEWLIAVDLFFAGRPRHDGHIVVPKKLTQSAYAGALFRQVLGPQSEHLLTLRHPVAACVSTYEKSGGLPPQGRFAVRSNIEAWCRRDLAGTGLTAAQIETLDYFEAYLRYWEHYHLCMLTDGLTAGPLQIVPFEPQTLQALARRWHERYGSAQAPARFEVSDKARRRHPEWMARARDCVARMTALWRERGLQFPDAALEECW